MKNVFLAPRANETAHDNFQSSIIAGRPYSFVEPFLTPNEKDILSKYETIKVWGTKESVKARWDKIQPGDFVLFYAEGKFYYSAVIILTKYSTELGSALWPAGEDGKIWPCLFFIDHVQEIEIPLKTIQELAEYESTWDKVQGFMRLKQEGVATIIEKFGSIESFIGQSPEVFQVIDTILEREKEEIVEGEKELATDKTKLLAEIQAYNDSGPSHVTKTTPARQRRESKAQKRKIAQIEGYACQICNWSLEWINAKGKPCYRIDVDHIVDKAKEGGEAGNNLWALCPNCHVKKTHGVITVDLAKKKVFEKGKEIKLHHDEHLGWGK